ITVIAQIRPIPYMHVDTLITILSRLSQVDNLTIINEVRPIIYKLSMEREDYIALDDYMRQTIAFVNFIYLFPKNEQSILYAKIISEVKRIESPRDKINVITDLLAHLPKMEKAHLLNE